MQKTIIYIAFLLFMCAASYAQTRSGLNDSLNFHINSLRITSFKKNIVPDPNLNQRLRLTDGQLMYWPFYPSTAQQMNERLKKDDRSVPQYLISEIVTSFINYRKNSKKPSGAIPKF